MPKSPSIKSTSSTDPKINHKGDYSINDVMSSLKSLHSEIQLIKSKLFTQEKTSERILEKTDSLAADILLLKNENILLRKEIYNLRSNPLLNNISTSHQHKVPIDIIRESKERESRSKNIIIFNVPDGTTNDKTFVDDLLIKLKLQLCPSSVIRIGNLNNKSRPIRVEFESKEAVISILKTKRLLFTHPEWKNIWISTDLTSYQREILSSMKKERDHRNSSSGEKTWFIKFVHGSPSLVQKN